MQTDLQLDVVQGLAERSLPGPAIMIAVPSSEADELLRDWEASGEAMSSWCARRGLSWYSLSAFKGWAVRGEATTSGPTRCSAWFARSRRADHPADRAGLPGDRAVRHAEVVPRIIWVGASAPAGPPLRSRVLLREPPPHDAEDPRPRSDRVSHLLQTAFSGNSSYPCCRRARRRCSSTPRPSP